MRKSHRIIRDVSLVLVFCVGFLGLIGLANFLQDDTEEQTSSEFSEYRLSADEATEGHDIDVTLKNLRALVENDPFDGRAQHELASTLFSRVIETQDSIAEANRTELQNQSKSSSQTSQLYSDDQISPALPSATSSQTADDRGTELASLINQAIQEYELAKQHPRYRSRSQVQLAVLLASTGDFDAALDNLEDFVNGGGATRRGLDQIAQFGSSLHRIHGPAKLHAYPRFSHIVAQEMQNRMGGGSYRSFENQMPRGGRSEGQLTLDRAPSLSQQDTGIWNFLERLNNDLIPYRIKLVNFIRKLFE